MTMIESQLLKMYQSRIDRGEDGAKIPAKNTLIKHVGNITILDKKMGLNTGDATTMEWADKPFDEINKVIVEMKGKTGQPVSLSTRNSYVTSLVLLIRIRYPEDHFEKQNFKDVKAYLSPKGTFKKSLVDYKQGATTRDKVHAPPKQKIDGIIDEFVATIGGDLMMKVILSIYKNHPIRLEVADLIYIGPRDYTKLKKNKQLTGNYVVRSKAVRGPMYFSFNDYKTFDSYGERKFPVKNKILKDMINHHILTSPLLPKTRLFGDMTRNQLSKKITGFFQKYGLEKVTPTVLTKLLLTQTFEGEDEKKTIERQKQLAYERGHSLGAQQNNYVFQ